MSAIDSFWSPRANPTLDDALAWASRHRTGAAIGAGGIAAFLFLRPSQSSTVIVVNPAGPVTTPPESAPDFKRAIGVGALVAAAVGVALYAARD